MPLIILKSTLTEGLTFFAVNVLSDRPTGVTDRLRIVVIPILEGQRFPRTPYLLANLRQHRHDDHVDQFLPLAKPEACVFLCLGSQGARPSFLGPEVQSQQPNR